MKNLIGSFFVDSGWNPCGTREWKIYHQPPEPNNHHAHSLRTSRCQVLMLVSWFAACYIRVPILVPFELTLSCNHLRFWNLSCTKLSSTIGKEIFANTSWFRWAIEWGPNSLPSVGSIQSHSATADWCLCPGVWVGGPSLPPWEFRVIFFCPYAW